MIEVLYDIRVDETDAPEEPLLDDAEIAQMIENTKKQLGRHVEAKLSKLDVPADQQPLRVMVSGVYSLDTEQMEISYHIDTDDKQLLLKAITALNH
jgi:hypothetical protein